MQQHTRRPSRNKTALKPSIINIESGPKSQKQITKKSKVGTPDIARSVKGITKNGLTDELHKKQLIPSKILFEPQEFIKKNSTRNSYDIYVIKKLIGKKILVPSKDILLTNKIKDDAKKIKLLLLDNINLSKSNQKNIIIHVVCVSGIMYVISGYQNYLALNLITYKDIESNEHLNSLEVRLIQLPKVSSLELHQLIEYLL